MAIFAKVKGRYTFFEGYIVISCDTLVISCDTLAISCDTLIISCGTLSSSD